MLLTTLALVMAAAGQGPAVWHEPFPAHKAIKEQAFRKVLAAQEDKAHDVKRDIPYAEPAHERQVLDVYSPPRCEKPARGLLDSRRRLANGRQKRASRSSRRFSWTKGLSSSPPTTGSCRAWTWRPSCATSPSPSTGCMTISPSYGGDPNRLFIMGHSAGAQLAALICTDDRYLKAEGLSLAIIKGCVPVDGDTYDVPAIIETAETRLAGAWSAASEVRPP